MPDETAHSYPHCPATIRIVPVGGLTRSELQEELQRNAISMNASADRLFASEYFAPSAIRYSVIAVEITVQDLDFPQGATTAEIVASAEAHGLGFCPIELGPHLRLQYRDQAEGYWGQSERIHQAPSGSITIISEPLSDDEDFPKGFYIRCIQGVLWLRGYRSGPEHVWQPDDHLIFRQL